ncbi:MAG: cytochrome c biogenesis protein CcsA [Bacteroidales bacterium]|nr:cytochrome c biogenesis protein CcsA [Bacteroidales bacterium]
MKRLKYLSFGILAVLVVAMMAATVLERLKGTPAAFRVVYHNPVFIALWAVVAVSGLIYLVRSGMTKRLFSFGIHVALVVILAGALVTHLFGESGMIHLRQDEATADYTLDDESPASLPFSIRLEKFTIDYHTGSRMPSGYSSAITFLPENKPVLISMNNIAKYRGYRFYQADYDEDGLGSILAVSHDPWGVALTYAGYLLLLVSMIGFFFQKDSGFRTALRRVVSATAAAAALLLVPATPASAAPRDLKDALGDMYVYYGHRVCPFETYLQETGLNATLENLDQVKIFPVAGPDGTVSWYSATDKLPAAAEEDESLRDFIRNTPAAVLQGVMGGDRAEALQVLQGIKAYQEKVAASVIPAPGKVRAERFYIRIARPRVQFMLSLALGLLLFVLSGIALTKGKRLPQWLMSVSTGIAAALWIYLTLVIVLRWVVSGTGPYVGRYNVMMLMAWFAMIAVLLLSRKFQPVAPMGFLVAGFTMLMASRSGVSPQITPLMPVLQSPLLSIHVVSMMLSYTLFGLVAFNGVLGLAVPADEAKERLRDASLVILYPAVFLLTFGTFLGAVWANISWGSYWAWDPKETWALVTMLVYGFALHGEALKAFRRPRFFHWYTILAFLPVLVTYFGVNLLLGGMHSYGA